MMILTNCRRCKSNNEWKSTPYYCEVVCTKCGNLENMTSFYMIPPKLTYYCDWMRHLACIPFSVANLHRMANELGIKRCWFHNTPGHPHYDIPKKRIAEIEAKCTVVSIYVVNNITRGRLTTNQAVLSYQRYLNNRDAKHNQR